MLAIWMPAALDSLAQQNIRIPENANSTTIPSWLFGARLSARDRLTSSCPDAIWPPPYLKNQIANHPSSAPGVTTKTTQQRCTQSPRAKHRHEGDTPG